MKIVILSDTHGNEANFKKAIGWTKKEGIETLIHCGDIGSHSLLKNMADEFSGKIHIVFGNIEDRQNLAIIASETENIILHGEIGELKMGKNEIAFCHLPNIAQALSKNQKYDIVFYGHSHKPWEEKTGRCRLVNPGNLLGTPYKATFAVYDEEKDKLELKILERL